MDDFLLEHVIRRSVLIFTDLSAFFVAAAEELNFTHAADRSALQQANPRLGSRTGWDFRELALATTRIFRGIVDGG